MSFLRKTVDFLVYSNLFIAGCAVLMVHQASWLLLKMAPDKYLTGFVFFSTICSYSFHWFLTSSSVLPSVRVQWTRRFHYFHLAFFIIGLVGAALFFYYLLPHWRSLAVVAIATFLYSAPKIPHPWFRALRKIAFGKTIFLSFVWMYVTSVLPVVVADSEWTNEVTLFAISRFFLIYAICILFDYRDRQDDKAAGIRSLITYFNEKGIRLIFAFSLLVFGVTTIGLWWYDYPALTIAILLLPGIITACLYNYAIRHFSDMFYYLVLDGLMALSALVMFLVPHMRDSEKL
jgi:4-hydroxybenzoate polyprenyltransferase